MGTLNPIEICLPVIEEDGSSSGEEILTAEEIGPHQFRLLVSPGFVEGLAAGDEIELVPDDLPGFRVLRRGGNLCVWFFLPDEAAHLAAEEARLRREVEVVGGYLDGGATALRIFTIPVSSGFGTVGQIFAAAEERLPGSTWMYGNVYDPRDGETPLNWWLA